LSADDWDAQLLYFLGKGYRVVAHDRRGHGRSSQVSGGHDMDHYAADASAVVEHLNLRNARQPRRAASIAAMSIFFISIIASKARFASSPPIASASVRTRGVICQEIPHLSLHHPHWLSCPPSPTIAFQYRSVSS